MTDLEKPAPVAGGNQLDPQNPWPGLASFTETQSAFFHGRSAEIRTLTRLLERNALTVLFGQSGLGKSSLLQAGVFPRLRAAGLSPIHLRLDHSNNAVDLVDQVKARVNRAAEGVGTWTAEGNAKAGESLWEFFHHRDQRLVDEEGRPVVTVLVFDQFEELFTLAASGGAQKVRATAFLGQLAELVENRPAEALVRRLEDAPEEMEAFDFGRTDYRVCISVREDYLPQLESLKQIMPALMETRMRLTRMTGAQALEAVLKPGGALTTPDVARAIVEFVAGARAESESLEALEVEPPLLSVICRELNERRRRRGQDQITADLVSGDRHEILSEFYARGVADVPPAVRRLIEDRMVTKSGFRDSLALEAVLEEPGVTNDAVRTLVDRRLVRLEERLGVQRIELSHDVLVPVIRASRDARVQQEAQRRTRRWLLAAAAASALALLGAGLGVRAQRQAERERRAEVVRSARTDLELADRLEAEGHARDALAYMVRAAEKNPGDVTIGPRLLSALTQRGFNLPDALPLALGTPPVLAQVSADGQRVFVQDREGDLRVINLNTWAIENHLRFAASVIPCGWALAENAADILAVELTNGTLLVCDAQTGAPRLPPIRRPSRVPSPLTRGPRLSLSADGRVLSTGDSTTVWFWDTATGRLAASQRVQSSNLLAGYELTAPGNRWTSYQGASRISTLEMPSKLNAVTLKNSTSEGSYRGARLSPDGSRILVAFTFGNQLLDPRDGVPLSDLPGGVQAEHVIFAPDGKRYVLATQNWNARLFEDGQVVATLPHRAPVTGLQLSADGATLLTCSANGEARAWDMATGVALGEAVTGHTAAPAVLSRDGSRMVLFSETGEAYRLAVARGPARVLEISAGLHHGMQVTFMADQPAQLLWMNQDRAMTVDVVDATLGTRGFTFPALLSDTAARPRMSIASRSGWVEEPALFSALVGARMQGWRWGGGSSVEAVEFESIPVTANRIIASERGDRATFTQAASRRLVIWDTRTGKRVSEFRSESEILGGAGFTDFTADGRRLLFQTKDGGLRIGDTESGEERVVLERVGPASEPLRAAAFTRDGLRVVAGNVRGQVQMWDALTGKLLRVSEGHRGEIVGLAVAATGRHFATWSTSGTVQVWDAATATAAGPAMRHERGARLASFTAGDSRIVTAADDNAVRVWDVASGQPVTGPLQMEDSSAVTTLLASPDARFVLLRAAARRHGRISYRLWSVPPPQTGNVPGWLIRLAAMCAGQRVTAAGELVSHSALAHDFAALTRELAALPEGDAMASWARWLLANPARRPLAPGFRATDEAVKQLNEAVAGGVGSKGAVAGEP